MSDVRRLRDVNPNGSFRGFIEIAREHFDGFDHVIGVGDGNIRTHIAKGLITGREARELKMLMLAECRAAVRHRT